MDSSHSAGFRLRLDLLIPILAFLIAASFSPLRLLACCTFPSIKPKLIRGGWRPAMASLDLDLCSLITISDHLVLITLEESTKTFETVYIAAVAAINSLRSRQHFHVSGTIYLSAIQRTA
jgi:hypothetical protein